MSQIDDKDLDRTAAIIHGMTPLERQDPKIINGSRRLRIANGSGVTVSEVNQLVDRFFEARKMMSQMGGMMPGMRRKSATRPSKNTRKQKKGKNSQAKGRQSQPNQARTPAGLPGGFPPGGFDPNTMTGLPPGMQMPDLSKLKLPKQ